MLKILEEQFEMGSFIWGMEANVKPYLWKYLSSYSMLDTE